MEHIILYSNIKFNLSNKEPEIKVNSGSVLGIPRNFYAWEVTNRHEERGAFLRSCCPASRHEGAAPTAGEARGERKSWLNVSFRNPKCSQLGQEILIFMAERGQEG